MGQTPLIFSLILFIIIINNNNPAAYASSRKSRHDFQVLDISACLNQARQVTTISSSNLINSQQLLQQQQRPIINSSFTLSLHPRSSLLNNNDNKNNYTSLTLSRLARDAARFQSILYRHYNSHRSRPQQQFESPVTSGASQGSGEYFAHIGVGRPVKEALMVLDSGSDVSWLQCQPCSDCYQQTNPVFNPSASSTYNALTCNSQQCNSLQVSACRTDSCLYQVSYGDGSYTIGEFATETISFGSSSSVPNVAIGCGHDNEGLFSGADGLMGLGRGTLSLPSQIKATSFSYCLVNRDATSSSSTLDFNSPQPPNSVQAPLLQNPHLSTFYYVALTGISVGGHPVDIPASLFEIGDSGKGGVILDSGTAVTRLRTEAYNLVRDSFVRLTRNLPSAAGFSLFDTCYDLSSMSTARVPTVAFMFAGGKTLPLPPTNYLIPVDNAGKFCFAFAGSSGATFSIIGNVQQQGTRVSYDLANKLIGFSPNKC